MKVIVILNLHMDILAELFGFIEKSCDSDYTVEKCYNNGTIESSKLVGGIAGGAWDVDGQNISIRNSKRKAKTLAKRRFLLRRKRSLRKRKKETK